jgi:hypothetical protein
MGSLVKEIAAITQEESIDLIVLELRKWRLFPDLATLKLLTIVKSLPCPVLLDPPNREKQPWTEKASGFGSNQSRGNGRLKKFNPNAV